MPIAEGSATTTTSELELSAEETERRRLLFAEVDKYPVPRNFVACLPNMMRSAFARLADETVNGATLDTSQAPDDVAKAEKIAQQMIVKRHSPYTLFFSAKPLPVPAAPDITMDDWVPLHVPNMHGVAKFVLVHRESWARFEHTSYVVRHHPSFTHADRSEVYEIYVMTRAGAELEFLRETRCSACARQPAPVKCATCDTRYCSLQCRADAAPAHDAACITALMNTMKLTAQVKRAEVNARLAAWHKEQADATERNKGKLVTVRHIDKGVVTETKAVVVPAADNPAPVVAMNVDKN